LREGLTAIFMHIFLILLSVSLFVSTYNFSFSSDNFTGNFTVDVNLNNRNVEDYSWYLSGATTYIEDFEDLSENFVETVPNIDTNKFYATLYDYYESVRYPSPSGTIEDTYYDDSSYLIVEDMETGTEPDAWTAYAEVWIKLRIDVSSLAAGTSYTIRIDVYQSVSSGGYKINFLEVTKLDSSGSILTVLYNQSYTYPHSYYFSLDTSKGSETYIQLYAYAYADDWFSGYVHYWGEAYIMVDWYIVEYGGGAAGTISTSIVYVASKAGTTSRNAGFSPLFELGSQLYGYYSSDVVTNEYAAGKTVTYVHTWDITDINASTAVADFCLFVSYATVDTLYVNYIKLIVEYRFSNLAVQYIVYFAAGETYTLTYGSDATAAFIMLKTSLKTLWVSLKTFEEKQPHEIADHEGLSISGSLEEINIKVEFSVSGTPSSSEPRCDFVVDWIGAWIPSDQISSVKYSLFYKISHKGFENITIVTVPTLDYDSSEYRQVFLWYDTSYTLRNSRSWATIDSIFTELEKYLPQLGYTVERVDSQQLADYLSAGIKAIVIFGGQHNVPDTVCDPAANNYLLRDWIQSGGIMISCGKIGAWISQEGTYKSGSPSDVFGYYILDCLSVTSTENLVESNITELAASLGFTYKVEKSGYRYPISLNSYKEYFNGRYIIYSYARVAQYDSEGKTTDTDILAVGWFQIEEGWVFHFGAAYEAWDVIRALMYPPFRQNKDVTNMQTWDDGYITTDVFYDDSFTECNSPDEEDPTYGFGEDGSDVSDWQYAYRGDVSSYSITTDGDSMIIQATDAGNGDTYLYYKIPVSLDLSQYPFVEVRFKVESTGSVPNPAVKFWKSGQTAEAGKIWFHQQYGYYSELGVWYTWRFNAYEVCKEYSGVTTVGTLLIGFDPINPETAGAEYKLYIDWIRVYTISSAMSIWGTANNATYVYSDGDVMHIVKTFDSTGNEYYFVRFDVTDVSTSGLYLEARLKASSPDVFGYFYASIDGVRKQVTPPIADTEWIIYRVDLSQYGNTLKWFEVGINDVSDSLASGTYTLYVDYIKIGSKGDWRSIWEFSASKFYDNPYWHFYDSLISPKFNLPENIPTGVYQYNLGVLMLIWGYNYIDGDTWYYAVQQDVATIRAVHTYDWHVFTTVPQITTVRGWPPNLAMIPLSSWLSWIYAVCLDFFAIYVKKRKVFLMSNILIVLGIYYLM